MTSRVVVVVVLALLLLAPGSPAAAQAHPPCGSEQMELQLENLPSLKYAGHIYQADYRLERAPGTRYYVPVNVRVTGPAGVVRRVSARGETGEIELAPQAAGTLTLAVSWDQQPDPGQPACSASTSLDIQVLKPLPFTIEPTRHGRSAYFAGFSRNGLGIGFTLTPGQVPRGYSYREVVDLTPVRIEARAVARAKRPSQAIEPAVLEYVPGARGPRRARRGLVTIVRRELDPVAETGRESVKILIATRPGFARRGVSVTLTQGTRQLGSFAAAGRCHSTNSFGLITGACDFRGRHAWLWAPCRKPAVTDGRFYGCYR